MLKPLAYFYRMFRMLLLLPVALNCTKAHGQFVDDFCPAALSMLQHWSDSLYQQAAPPPRYLSFEGKPSLIAITRFKVSSERSTSFNPNKPFLGLDKEVGTRTVFRFDGLGRLTSRRRTDGYAGGTETYSELDSLEYGPDKVARWIHGPDYMEVAQYEWEGGRIVSKETLNNGFVIGRTTWSYDDSLMTIDSEESGAFGPDVQRTHWTLLAKDTVASLETILGKDTSRTEYRYFNDSLCTLYWSNDTNEFKGGEPRWIQARSKRLLPGGDRLETVYINDEPGITRTETYVNGRLMRISRNCDESTFAYNDRGDPVRYIDKIGCEELPGINQILRYQFHYQYDAIGNPTEILYMNGLDRFNSWPNDWPSEISLWHFEYDYP